jgi:hypothetical protein
MAKLNDEIYELNSHQLDQVSGGAVVHVPPHLPPYQERELKYFEQQMANLWARRLPPHW